MGILRRYYIVYYYRIIIPNNNITVHVKRIIGLVGQYIITLCDEWWSNGILYIHIQRLCFCVVYSCVPNTSKHIILNSFMRLRVSSKLCVRVQSNVSFSCFFPRLRFKTETRCTTLVKVYKYKVHTVHNRVL